MYGGHNKKERSPREQKREEEQGQEEPKQEQEPKQKAPWAGTGKCSKCYCPVS